MSNSTTKTNGNGFADLMKSIAIPENAKTNAKFSIYKKEVFAKLSALDETGAKRMRKQLRNERNSLIIEGLQQARNLGENAFKEWVKNKWIPFAENTYRDPQIFFEKTKASNPEKIQLLENFAKLLQICK